MITVKAEKKVAADIALHENPISELQDVTCHMRSHSVTFHPTQVNAARLTPAMQAGTRFTYPGGMEGWVDLVAQTLLTLSCLLLHCCYWLLLIALYCDWLCFSAEIAAVRATVKLQNATRSTVVAVRSLLQACMPSHPPPAFTLQTYPPALNTWVNCTRDSQGQDTLCTVMLQWTLSIR